MLPLKQEEGATECVIRVPVGEQQMFDVGRGGSGALELEQDCGGRVHQHMAIQQYQGVHAPRRGERFAGAEEVNARHEPRWRLMT